MNLSKSNYQTHIYFISLIAIHYLISIIFIGQVIVEPHDNLDILVVYDHVISKIYKGDIEKLNYFLSGEIKWYYLEKLFYPINILHYILNDKLFYSDASGYYDFGFSEGIQDFEFSINNVLDTLSITFSAHLEVEQDIYINSNNRRYVI